MKKINWLKITKISVGCCLAVLIANALGLRSGTSAGIITLLSIQDTKRATLRIARQRLLAFFLAVLSALITFGLLGFHTAAFGVFLFFFVFLCCLLGLQAGISTNTVLVTHFWSAKMLTLPLILNELLLLALGTGTAVLINLYMPRAAEAIREDQRAVDGQMRHALFRLADLLEGKPGAPFPDFAALSARLERALQRACENMENTLTTDMRYYVQYIELRSSQSELLEQISDSAKKLRVYPPQAKRLAGFLRQIARSFHEYNNAESLLEELVRLREGFRASPLPQTRPEFETRALLFQIAIDLEYLLIKKRRFAQSLTDWQIGYFWNGKQPASKNA